MQRISQANSINPLLGSSSIALLITLIAFVLMPGISLASRARVESGQTFYDSESTYSLFNFPTLLDFEKKRVLFESGDPSSGASQRLPGGLLQLPFEGGWALLTGVGLPVPLVSESRDYFNASYSDLFSMPQNSIAAYALKKFSGQAFSLGLHKSEFNSRQANLFEESTVASIAYRWRFLNSTLHLVLEDGVNKSTGEELRLRQPFEYSILYSAGESEFYFNYQSFFQIKSLNSSEVNSIDKQDVIVGYLDQTRLNQIHFKYRIEYHSRTVQDRLGNSFNRSNYIPLIFAFESNLNSSLKLIGSVRQPVIVNQGSADQNITNQTNVVIGSEWQWERVKLSGVLQGLSGPTASQKLDGSNVLTRVSLQYDL